MGNYSKMLETFRNGKPVWKMKENGNQEYFLFYNDFSYWRIGINFFENEGNMSSIWDFLSAVPDSSWVFSRKKDGIWIADVTLKVVARVSGDK